MDVFKEQINFTNELIYDDMQSFKEACMGYARKVMNYVLKNKEDIVYNTKGFLAGLFLSVVLNNPSADIQIIQNTNDTYIHNTYACVRKEEREINEKIRYLGNSPFRQI